MEATRRPPYRLEALAKVRSAERDALRLAAAAAAEEAERRARECEAAGRSVARAESALRAMRGSGNALSVDQEIRLQSYLAAERRREAATRARRDEALRAMAGVAAELAEKQRDLKALERHRSRARDRLDEQERRATQKASDDAWLAGAARRRG